LMYPWCLEVMVFCMLKFPDAAYGLISSSQIKLGKRFPVLFSPKETYQTYFFKSPVLIIGPTGSIIRTKYFKEVNGFSGTQFIGDTELWLKLSMFWPMIIMPPDLIWWRTHDDQQSVYESKHDKATKLRFEMVLNALSNPNCPIRGDLSRIAIRNQKNIQSRRLFFYVLKTFDVVGLKNKLKQLNLNIYDLIKASKKNKIPYTN
jgi:hypothetical protein